MSTNIGREALMVLTVVSGRHSIALSPDTQESETRTAFSIRLRWSGSDPVRRKRKGDRYSAVSPVAVTRIQ